MKILYIEDHLAQRDLMTRRLELAGYELALARTGEEGLQKTQTWHPDLILIDVRLPGMGGLEAIKQLKRDPAVATIPIIVISAWTSREDREQAFQAGADSFMAKPIEFERLIKRIEQWGKKGQQGR
jgi:CheY-like chemotaxis protein